MGTQGRASSPPPPPLAAGDSPASKDHFIADTSGDPQDSETQDHLEDCEPVDEGSRPVTQDDTVSSAAASLHNVLFDKIVRQVEYYFSDENLPNDAFLLKQVRKDKEGTGGAIQYCLVKCNAEDDDLGAIQKGADGKSNDGVCSYAGPGGAGWTGPVRTCPHLLQAEPSGTGAEPSGTGAESSGTGGTRGGPRRSFGREVLNERGCLLWALGVAGDCGDWRVFPSFRIEGKLYLASAFHLLVEYKCLQLLSYDFLLSFSHIFHCLGCFLAVDNIFLCLVLDLVPITLISSFKKMKKLTKDLSLIEAALRTSSLVVVSSDGKRVKRLHPLPVAEVRNEKPRTVLVENLPEDYSEDSIRRIFGTAGHIVGVAIRNPHSAEQLATLKKADFAVSSKLHALVEYDTVEAAETAVLTLNDEMNWRNGMRVQILLKRMEKYGLVPKRRKDTFSEKIKVAEASEMPVLNQNGLEKEEEENANGSKAGRGNRYKSRGRGHGNAISGSSAEGLFNKPISGPKMPDGTRGFTMGRGRPITT
ncbi:hypothetical protein MA16_Dca000359 [Dendrobium catenatum]|uniref:La-related protein 6A n=1 Tax=Dendrobium catenatum TaxID=906689 RepID=A0A2I0WTM6_9ASPA|nr:hypothetical protein MA16_Dca000359 [Dendrobium catenatum]